MFTVGDQAHRADPEAVAAILVEVLPQRALDVAAAADHHPGSPRTGQRLDLPFGVPAGEDVRPGHHAAVTRGDGLQLWSYARKPAGRRIGDATRAASPVENGGHAVAGDSGWRRFPGTVDGSHAAYLW